jgi:hypothetical protein
MTKPHESLGLHQPIGRRLPRGMTAWNLLIATVTLVSGVIYIVQVNAATTKGYSLRTLDTRVEQLKNETMIMQDKIATLSSMQALSDRATQLGFVPIDKLEFVDPSHKSYAMAR